MLIISNFHSHCSELYCKPHFWEYILISSINLLHVFYQVQNFKPNKTLLLIYKKLQNTAVITQNWNQSHESRPVSFTSCSYECKESFLFNDTLVSTSVFGFGPEKKKNEVKISRFRQLVCIPRVRSINVLTYQNFMLKRKLVSQLRPRRLDWGLAHVIMFRYQESFAFMITYLAYLS